ncbi:MAG: hypothetical protein Q8K98_06260 [Bacteroidota bacterium]|nr:hypothetical protein [Bacteroidota bacterium]
MSLQVAVSDTSVLINLHHLELLESLSLFYREVLVPAPVRGEFLDHKDQRAREIALNVLTERGFFSPCDDFDSVEVDIFKSYKMEGAEAEALSQMKLRNADILLIDEKIGRKIAEREMRTVIGTVSLLAKFHKLGLVDYLSAINRLKTELGMRISNDVVQAAFNNQMNQ